MSAQNPYRGINAHFNSQLQTKGDWADFHLVHIADLMKALKIQLRPMGYTAAVEQSLQILRFGEARIYPKSDVTIYDTQLERQFSGTKPTLGNSLEVVLPIPELLEIEDIDYYKALAIYPKTPERGEPVVWIELLSPSNKPPHRDFKEYKEKRKNVLESGIVFVEIDYLHQYPPTFSRLADYSASEPDSHPYRITVIDPRPEFLEGEGRSLHFDVNSPIPTMEIPLNAGDILKFDFDAPYQKTFEETLYGEDLDYSQPPLEFETYSQADQARIRQLIEVIANDERFKKGDN